MENAGFAINLLHMFKALFDTSYLKARASDECNYLFQVSKVSWKFAETPRNRSKNIVSMKFRSEDLLMPHRELSRFSSRP